MSVKVALGTAGADLGNISTNEKNTKLLEIIYPQLCICSDKRQAKVKTAAFANC